MKSSSMPWKDPRFAIGVAFIAGGGLAGSFVLSGEESVGFLRADQPIAAGAVLQEGQFVIDELPERVGSGYVRVGEIPEGAVAAHSIAEGELLAGSALGGSHDSVDLSVPLMAAPPASTGIGSKVEVWRVRSAQFGSEAQAHRIADAVLVSLDSPDSVGVSGVNAHIRLSPADVPEVLEVLGTQDGLVVVSETGAQ